MLKPPRSMTAFGTTIVTQDFRHDQYPSGNVSYTKSIGGDYPSYSEVIDTDSGPGWHNCTHTRSTWQRFTTPVPLYVEWDAGNWFTHYAAKPELWSSASATDHIGSYYLSPSQWGELDNRALSAMMPEARSDVSLLNSIYELKDVVSLKRSIGRLSTFGAAVRQLVGSAHKALRAKWVSFSLAKLAADLRLQQQFNINPLIRDIGDTIGALRGIKKFVKELLDRENLMQKRHYSRDVSDLLPDLNSVVEASKTMGLLMWHDNYCTWVSADLVNSAYSHGGKPKTRTTLAGSAKFCATLEFRYSLDSFTREHALVLALLDKLGVNLNPAILWNATPWTFVLDWVVGVSDYLDRMKVRNVRPRVNIARYCSSVKTDCNVTIHACGGSTTHFPYSEVLVAQGRTTSYARKVGDPGIRNWLTTSGLSLKELELLYDLAITRDRRGRR